MSFDERLRQLQIIVETIELNVLVWGPGQGATEHFAKREKIRQEIKTNFPNADVRFSEELEGLVPGAADLSLPEQELWHLAACDVCIVLDTSKGAGEEIAHFSNSAWTHKLLILTHEQYKEAPSFPASLRKNQYQIFYSTEEYDSCSLVERVLARIRRVALGRLGGMLV